jgi:hypothetical protein
MVADRRLALSEDGAKFCHTALTLGERQEDVQTDRISYVLEDRRNFRDAFRWASYLPDPFRRLSLGRGLGTFLCRLCDLRLEGWHLPESPKFSFTALPAKPRARFVVPGH